VTASAARSHVSLETSELHKASLADVARERLIAAVRARVDLQIGRRHTRARAGRTVIRPLLGVNSHVQFEVAGLDELSLADRALVRLLARVRPTVNLQAHVTTQPCIPPGSLNRVPASAGVRAGMSPLPGGR